MRETSSRRSTRKVVGAPPSTPESKENQLVSLAYDLAEQQIRDGTVSAQALTHFLKLGSIRGKLEEKKLENENLLLSAKVDQLASAKKIESLYEDAMRAFKGYSGLDTNEFDDFDGFDSL